ncbi:hypothetical protein LSH36_83g04012 [Paralvinella palmiformis]|uniref:Uncharacterized protein n=1 Tax=Paralvinella palmiformis TaxID=53620 RepID=A0AAD9NAM9_9ANNE|nr:hypothetical protein LSH36_83g04012 [Paralvinella palmiformis]
MVINSITDVQTLILLASKVMFLICIVMVREMLLLFFTVLYIPFLTANVNKP